LSAIQRRPWWVSGYSGLTKSKQISNPQALNGSTVDVDHFGRTKSMVSDNDANASPKQQPVLGGR
jgi:hypothetical protein